MLVQLFLSASAAILVSAQFGAPPAAPPGCTSNSFTLPSWLVQNFESSDGKAAFHLINRATNGTADLTCAVSGSGWSACSAEGKSDLEASIRIDGNKANLKVNETWVCKDRPGAERFTFSGAATSEFALSCAAGKPCVSTNPQILLKATLSSPISATPAYLEGPTGHDLAGCKATSQSPTWTVSMVYFVDQKGDGISAMPTTSVNLAFTNDANQYQVSCMVGNLGLGDDDPTAADGLIPLTCAGYEFQSFTTGRYALSTAANFDPKTMTLNLNQTWYCDDTDPGRPTVIKGSASQALDLNCTDTVAYGFPRKTCAVSADLKVKGKLGSEDPLTPFSIADPMPAGDGCTVSSIFAPKWTLSALEIDGKEAANPSGSVSFNIILATGSQGFQYPIAITQGAAVNGSAGWHECEVGPDGGIGQPLWPYRCAFKYDAAAKELTLDADWMCTDIDPKHPVLFTGVTTTTVNSTLACDTADGLSRCQTTDPFFSWAAPISNVTWKAGP